MVFIKEKFNQDTGKKLPREKSYQGKESRLSPRLSVGEYKKYFF